MLTARNLIVLTIIIAVVSLAWACRELAQAPDSGGLGDDTYGTKVHGQRGLFEILSELNIPVERLLAPPSAVIGRDVTLVLWKPQPELVQVEPAYLQALAHWVESGGRVVVAPDSKLPESPTVGASRRVPAKAKALRTVLTELGLPSVSIWEIDRNPNSRVPTPESTRSASGSPGIESPKNRKGLENDDVRRLRELLSGDVKPIATRSVSVDPTGVFSYLRGLVTTIGVPEERMHVLKLGDSKPDGTITLTGPGGTEGIVAASYRRGAGELIVVASAAIAENFLVAGYDNSILAVHLMAVPGRSVVFDEFYHGLTIRGNPLWLFTQPGYAATTLSLLLLFGIWIWRESIFLGPPLASEAQSRRSIGEYIEAMARFLNRGGTSQAFLLREVRAGVLRAIRDELHLGPSRDHVEELAAVLARRDPRRARELVEAVGAVDAALSRNVVLKESVAVDLFKRISHCL